MAESSISKLKLNNDWRNNISLRNKPDAQTAAKNKKDILNPTASRPHPNWSLQGNGQNGMHVFNEIVAKYKLESLDLRKEALEKRQSRLDGELSEFCIKSQLNAADPGILKILHEMNPELYQELQQLIKDKEKLENDYDVNERSKNEMPGVKQVFRLFDSEGFAKGIFFSDIKIDPEKIAQQGSALKELAKDIQKKWKEYDGLKDKKSPEAEKKLAEIKEKLGQIASLLGLKGLAVIYFAEAEYAKEPIKETDLAQIQKIERETNESIENVKETVKKASLSGIDLGSGLYPLLAMSMNPSRTEPERIDTTHGMVNASYNDNNNFGWALGLQAVSEVVEASRNIKEKIEEAAKEVALLKQQLAKIRKEKKDAEQRVMDSIQERLNNITSRMASLKNCANIADAGKVIAAINIDLVDISAMIPALTESDTNVVDTLKQTVDDIKKYVDELDKALSEKTITIAA